jgi:outer membrane protein OmpA-like peptidoglycan-associated protein
MHMANHNSTQERLGAAPAPTLRATCISLAPLLLAALLVGCSTKATHLGSLSGDPTLAGNDTPKRRASSTPGGPPNAATSGSADSASASQGGAGSSQEGVGAGRANDLASNEAGASSSGDSAAGVSGGAHTGGNRASSTGSKTGAAGAGGAVAASSAAASQGSARDSAIQTAEGNDAAGAAGGGKPGTRARNGSSSAGGGGAAGGNGNAQGDAEGADLSQGDSTAALESGAAGAGRNRKGATGTSGAGGGAGGDAAAGMAGGGVGGDTAAAMQGDGRIAAIDVPSGKVKVDEEYRPQTLGGALPLVLGVNEEGRFDFDQYLLRPEVRQVLDELAAKLKTAEYDRLDIVGYTDRIGTTDYNHRLSELRAYAVAQYLMGKGVPQNKIHYEGRGEKNPLTPSADCQGLAREDLITCLQKDRRVEIEASIHRKHATVVQ